MLRSASRALVLTLACAGPAAAQLPDDAADPAPAKPAPAAPPAVEPAPAAADAPLAPTPDPIGDPAARPTRRDRDRAGPELIEVTGDRLDTRAGSPYPLSGVSRKDFVHQPKSLRLADIIDRMPGVFGSGDLGANTDTGLRGLSHHWTRFEFDGIMLPGMDVGRDFRINSLSPIAVEEIISLRNPPPEYESDGIGGHIVALRRPIPEEFQLEVMGGAGFLQGDAVGTGLVGDAAFAIGAPLGEDFGFTTFFDFNRYPIFKKRTYDIVDNETGALVETQTQDSESTYENINVISDFAWFYGDGEVHVKPMFLLLRQYSDGTTLREFQGDPTRRIVDTGDRPRYRPGITVSNLHRFSPSSFIESDVSYYYAEQDSTGERSEVRTGDDGTFAPHSSRDTSRTIIHKFPQVRAKLTQGAELLGMSHLFKIGVMGRWREYHTADLQEDYDAAGDKVGESTPEGEYTVWENYYAFFAQDEVDLSEDLTLLFGARVEYSDNAVEVFRDNEANEAANRDTTKDSTTFDVNPSVSLLYRLADAWSFRATGSRTINRPGYRQQSTLELDREVIERGNPELIPTRSWNFDVGVDFAPNDDVFLAVTAYKKYLSDVVELVDTGEIRDEKPIYQYDNIGDGDLQGIELEQRIGLGAITPALDGLTLWANETLLETEVTLADGTRRPFSAHSNFLANVGVDWNIEASGTLLSTSLKYQGEYENTRTSEDIETTEPTFFLNAAIGQEIVADISLNVEVQNLLGEQQATVRDRPATTETGLNEYGRFVRLSVYGRF